MRNFAYGSNLCGGRLRGRAPSARFAGRAILEGFSLRFHKRGADGSAKADAFRTSDAGDIVWGAIFECSAEDKLALDTVEGLGTGYDEQIVSVRTGNGQNEQVRLYIAMPHAIDDSLEPFRWYVDCVIAGAEEHGLPHDYIEAIRELDAIADPDIGRERANRCTSRPGQDQPGADD